LNGFPAGSICNTQAFILNPGPGSLTFPAPFDFFTGFATAGLALTMGDPPPMVTPGGPQPSTYSKGEYGGNGPAGQLLVGTFALAFPNGLEVGDYNTMMGACPPNGLLWTLGGLNSLRTYLLGGGTMSGSFDADALNPSGDFGGGPFGRNVVALALNIRFHELGLLGGTPGDFGHLMYIDPGSSMHMHTVNEIFAETQQAIAGFSLPPGYSFVALAQLIENLNLSFHNSMPSMWAGMHLFAPGP
jgi:hypothetical protein